MRLDQHQERSLLRDLLVQKSVQVGRDFKLASGAVTNVYIDAKRTTLYLPEAMPLIGRCFLRKFAQCGWQPRAVGGKTVGADPIAIEIARESIDFAGHPIGAFIVRKEPKKHGMQQFIEGPEQTNGLPVVIVDDVCTAGTSTGEAIAKAQTAGMVVLGAVCLVDREAGATDFLAREFGCQLESIFKLSELVSHDESRTVAELTGTHK